MLVAATQGYARFVHLCAFTVLRTDTSCFHRNLAFILLASHAGPTSARSMVSDGNSVQSMRIHHNMPLPVCSLRSSHTVLPEQLQIVLSLSQTPALRAITPTRVSGSSG